ncbi:sensor domain-containing phosphodiesterase [Sphingomonas carotinifaciens]|uniref:EAL domain, c-di-GMP-specific phosphodiesterase class I (Or its enzymatically inactive variant) n=1 Tax=Sphingomonas carotinifaciens TaxID=1166323 RepID=A0A1G7MQ32_9SPHN|nr:sensor domain-containing phosphodiesterase [Sphingomonas carotinifaciens]MBB4086734.1 EAL domain-containing protein (putative c-di-GMP-specific phosphodiesterase class I)/GGDEF domain-containing protein [Sphingomonas carotinifaciens]MWC42204.1 EAL domain-containing protein [Sphingomonas carotinifaciens]SDF63766.1 EAL domain, c-di-GMP-specific phosphodiesterase class I (or its enzymatically inactive variant) [Sphingomonas carotinifaciens]
MIHHAHDYREEARLDALYQLKLLDTSPSESFDRITRMASQIFGLPVAAVSLTDWDRQWFKSRVGVDHCSIPRDKAPCAQVAESTEPLVIEDMAANPCYADSVLGRAGTRFYAGAPLITSDGYGLGALCVLGSEPRQISSTELSALVDLAAMVMVQIELQHAFGRVDPVSGLATRNQFRDDLIDMAREHPGEERLAVVVDLARDDQISRIARVMGGARVDEMIREATRSLRAALGSGRAAYHVGSAQFAFLSPAGVEQVAYMEELRSAFAAIRSSSSVRFVTNVAIGVRPFILGRMSADDVLRGAVSAAQDARSVDGSVATYSSANDTAHRRQYGLLRDFGRALEAGDQLRLAFQPRIDLATGRCVGAEALLRWRHPRLGEVSPAEFIPIIEQTSLARATTQWVLDTAMDQLAKWRMGGALTVSVNISATNLAETDLIDRIRSGLLRRGLQTGQLEIELTESAIMAQPEQALAMLHDMADAGICLAIDDFGTGHSSLAYLQRLPARVVKIDQLFIRNLTQAQGSDFVLVETMIGLAHKLGYRVVAEGIETQAAADMLVQLGCEEAQGFWFGRPMEAAAFVAWLGARRPEAA